MVQNTVRSSPTVHVLEYGNLTQAPGHAVCEISERRQLPAVCRDARKVGPVVLCHGSYALLEVAVRPYQRHDLPDTHPSVYRQFAQGHFTVQKTGHTTSLALDQTQLNEVIKGDLPKI